MTPVPELFLDTSVLVSAVFSDTGAARRLLELGEFGVVQIVVSRRVVTELERVLERKQPELKADFLLLLDCANVVVHDDPEPEEIPSFPDSLPAPGDRDILAAVIDRNVDFFATFDRNDMLESDRIREKTTVPLGTAGDALNWVRARISP